MKKIALKEIQRYERAILHLETFGFEHSAESYLLKYPGRSKAQAEAYARKQLEPQIKMLQDKIYKLELFIDMFNVLEEKQIKEEEGYIDTNQIMINCS